MLYPLFFVSGALGLVYEVLWLRQLTLLFGGTTLATTATLSAFFLGTSVGSFVLGAKSRTWSRPLRAFGLLEIGVGLGALVVDPILRAYPFVYAGLYGGLAPFPVGFALVKLLLAVVAIGWPTFLMGGTLPALGEVVAPGGRRLGIPVGGLYAINLLGAIVGALLVPFVLLPWLGVRGAYLAAVAGSVTTGAIAFVLGSRAASRAQSAPSNSVAVGEPASRGTTIRSSRAVLILAAWSGAGTLGLQVLWTRMFSLVHENSAYSFAIVVVVFLAGLFGGALLARFGLRRGLAAERLLGWAWALAGVLIVISPRVFYASTNGLEYLPGAALQPALERLLLLAVVTMLPACVALGSALPLLMDMCAGGETSAGPLLGRLLSVNTAGAILGPLLVTFLVAPALGLWKSVMLVGGLTLLAGHWAGLTRRTGLMAWSAFVAAAWLCAPAALPPVRARTNEGERIVSLREGSYGTTAVLEDSRDRWITVNNSYVLGGAAAAGEQRWQGHLPLLLHPAARRVAFVGLGTGITAGAALLHPVEQVVALELVPDVVTAARQDFGDLNARVIDDARVRVVTDDGRNYLFAAPGAFDVVVGDLLVPWRPTESSLYTREHFESVRRALSPNGIFCQWLPLYQLSESQLAILLRTFVDVFPRTTLWRGNFLASEPTLALVGQRDDRPLDVAGIDRRAATLAPTLDERTPFLAHPSGVWLFLVGALDKHAPALAQVPSNSDDSPWVELSSATGHVPFTGKNLAAFLERVTYGSLADSPLTDLDVIHRGWKDTGAALARASLERGPAGEERVLAILRTLPPELQGSLGVAPR